MSIETRIGWDSAVMRPARVLLLLLGFSGIAASAAAESGARPLLAQADASSMDDLFGSDEPEESAPAGEDTEKSVADDAQPGSVDELFGEEPAAASSPADKAAPGTPVRLTGFYDNKLAYTYEDPDHWSRFANTLELSLDGRNGPVEWKLSGRAVYDAVFAFENFYPEEVEDDQEFEFTVRESYVDFSQGDWDLRLGRQHIIWGEMVGLFFADVVSAKDLREFVLQDFDILRIPQWAARVEYFRDDLHTELVWIPYMTYNNVGMPGAEFFPPLAPASIPDDRIVFERDQPQDLDDGAYGARLTYIVNGWDLSGFYYNSRDASPAFERSISLDPAPVITFRELHERIGQTGGTLAKDFGSFVLKGEAIYTTGRPFGVIEPADPDGLVEQDLLDYVLGLEWALPEDGRLNLQFFQRWFPDHDDAMIPDDLESGVSFLASRRFGGKWEPEVLLIQSVNRADSLLRAKLTWYADGNWKLIGGVDVFSGSPDGLFGQYDARDRVYTEVRFSF